MTENLNSDETGAADYTPAEPGTTLNIDDGTFVLEEVFGDIDVIILQKGGDKTASIKTVALVPGAKKNPLSAKMTVNTSSKKITFFPDMGYLGKEDAMEARRTATKMTPLTAKSSRQRDMMDMHRLLCHAHDGMARDTAEVAGITMTGE